MPTQPKADGPSLGCRESVSLKVLFTQLALASSEKEGMAQETSPAPQFESIHSSVLSLRYGPTLTSVHDYWKNHSLD